MQAQLMPEAQELSFQLCEPTQPTPALNFMDSLVLERNSLMLIDLRSVHKTVYTAQNADKNSRDQSFVVLRLRRPPRFYQQAHSEQVRTALLLLRACSCSDREKSAAAAAQSMQLLEAVKLSVLVLSCMSPPLEHAAARGGGAITIGSVTYVTPPLEYAAARGGEAIIIGSVSVMYVTPLWNIQLLESVEP